jgi:hypothetical protein
MSPFWITVTGLALNLLGAIFLALADYRTGWWVDASLLALELNFLKLRRLMRKGGAEVMVDSMDVPREQTEKWARRVKTAGWVILCLGYALQILAAALPAPRPTAGTVAD